MEIVMKKKKTFCPRKEHLAMIAAAVGIGMALAFWCLVWPVTGHQGDDVDIRLYIFGNHAH